MGHSAERDAAVASLDQRRAKRNESLPTPGEPAITFGMDDDRITFRDQAALDEYVAGAILEHSRYHGGGVDECSSDSASPCARHRLTPPAEQADRLPNACACGDCYHPVVGPNTDGEPCDFCRDCGCPSADHTRMTRADR